MIVSVNGERREVGDDATIATIVSLVSRDGPAARGIAVAVAGEVVPRGQWPTTSVHDGAEVEVVTAVQGG
jgi:sulfur carrier protein